MSLDSNVSDVLLRENDGNSSDNGVQERIEVSYEALVKEALIYERAYCRSDSQKIVKRLVAEGHGDRLSEE